MALFAMGSVFAFSGDTLAQGAGTAVRLARAGEDLARFDVDAPAEWLKVSPNGKSVLIYGARGTRAWRWREGAGLELFATATGSRDAFGCGFIVVDGSVCTVLAQAGVIRGLSDDGRELFAANVRSPHSFRARDFVQFPGGRVALVGSFFGDYSDTVVTLPLESLIRDPDGVQKAIRSKAPVWDRAVDLAVGPCEPRSAVVLRDPEDTETPEDEEDGEDLGDVGNFAGVYVRDLDTGALVERHAYSGRAGSGAPIAATPDWIAVQVIGGIDMIRRGSGAVHEVPTAILDVAGQQVARLRDGGLIEVVSLTQLGPP
jgi:hypothetical protein